MNFAGAVMPIEKIQDIIMAINYGRREGRCQTVLEWTFLKIIHEDLLDFSTLELNTVQMIYLFIKDAVQHDKDEEQAVKVL
jgi:hypothetical protein